MTEARPWDQFEDEPNRWYQRFCAFRLMGPGRSFNAAENAERVAKGLEKSDMVSGSWRNAAKEWNWVARAEAWDQYQTQQHEAAIEAIWQANAMGKAEVISRLADIGRGDIADLMDARSTGFMIELITEGEDGKRVINPKTKLIKKIKQKVTTFSPQNGTGEDREVIETEIELYSAHDALRDIGKVHGLFVDKTEIAGADGGPLTWVEFVKGKPDAAE